jgi:Protein of unknown function (DUF3311)
MAKRSGEPQSGRVEEEPGRRGNWALALLILPFVALLYPPFYARLDPMIGGVPFFIWYQFLWVVIGSLITAVVYRIRRRED